MIVRSVRLDRKLYTFLMAVFVVMIVQSALRGVMVFGVVSEFLSDLRKYLYFIVAILYFWKMPFKRMDDEFWKKLEIIFWCITIYMWVIMAFYFAGHPLGERASQRPLLADYAIVYTIYLAIRWYQDMVLKKSGKISRTTLVFTVTLIFNRFNTTWASLGVAVGVLLLGRLWDKNHGKISNIFYIQLAAVILGAVYFMRFGNDVTEALIETTEKFDASQDNTFSSRIELWKSLMTFVKGHYAVIGYPFGSGFHAIYRGSKWQVSPHNGYLEVLLRSGYIGLAALVGSMITIITKALRQHMILPVMILATCMTYWISYSLTLEQGVFIGLCVRAVLGQQREKTDVSAL